MEKAKKEGVQADEALPTTRRRVSFAPLAVPPPQPLAKKTTSTKHRWSLIRSLTKGKRLTSLSDDEESLLKTMSSSASSRELNKVPSADSTDADEGKARQVLRKSIALHKDMLSEAEAEFLNDLVDAPDVGPEDLEHVHEVLCNDPLYQCDDETKKTRKQEEKVECAPPRRCSILQSPSYRKELWIQLRNESQEVSQETFAFSLNRDAKGNDETVQVKEEEIKSKPEQKQESPKRGFLYKFQKALNLVDNRDKDDETAELDEDDWDDEDTTFCVLARSIHDILERPTVLTPPIMDSLRAFLPFAVAHDNFWLKYSFDADGASMHTLLDKIRNSARTFIAIETDQGDVFGSFTSSPWRIQSRDYYGSAEAFLWRLKKSRFTPCKSVKEQIELESDIEVFEWSRHNRNIQSWTGMNGQLSVGGGGYEDEPEKEAKEFGAGLSLSDDLSRGFSDKCLTFNSPVLPTRSTDGVFNIVNIEVWTLTPVISLDEAERLELGRQFVFDHGRFVKN